MLFGFGVAAFAQKGTISGHVKEKTTGDDVIGGNVRIEGTTAGASTDISGNFSFPVDPGMHKLVVTYIGFQKLVVDVEVKAGENTKIELQLEAENQQLQEVVVTGKADKTSESNLMVDRKNAIGMLQNIGAQELSRKGVSNVEAAVVQVTGVSKQQGQKNVFVRGLGDRYNSTSLNGLPLPSEDPAYKNISLDFFTTNIINSIDVNKTMNARMYGDVAGANINIVSKELFEERELTVSASVGVNSLTAGKNFYRADGTNFLGVTDKTITVNDLSQYSFKNSMNTNKVDGPLLNSSLSISGGRNFDLSGGSSLAVFLVGGMNSEYIFKTGVSRTVNPDGTPRQDFDYDRYDYNVSQLGLANVTYRFVNGNTLTYSGIVIHDNKQSVGNYTGFSLTINDNDDENGRKSYVQRQQMNDNLLFVNQLMGDFKLNDKFSLALKGSYNSVLGNEPDRRTTSYRFDGESYVTNTGSVASNNRFYSDLTENEFAGDAELAYKVGKAENDRITVGYNFRNTARKFESTQFNHSWSVRYPVDIENPDGAFNQQSIDNGTFQLLTSRGSNEKAFIPFFYTGDRTMHGAFVSLDYELTPALSLNAGLRFEHFYQKVRWDVNIDEINPNVPDDNTVVKTPNYLLPSLNLKYSLSDANAIRLASSKTYTFPQFKELAPFLYEDINFSSFGNPYLLPAENINVDLKFEHYFGGDELIAFTGFFKSIKNTINRVLVASAANEISYVNTGNATVAGAEMEFRKKFFDSPEGGYLSYGLNLSYLYSNQELKDVDSDKLTFQPTNDESTLEGASSLLINSDLTFVKTSGLRKFTTAVVFNYFSDRIFTIGAPNGNQHIYERGIPTLNFITKYSFNDKLSVNLSFKNILNPEFKLTQEVSSGNDEVIRSYKKGMDSSIGVSYRF